MRARSFLVAASSAIVVVSALVTSCSSFQSASTPDGPDATNTVEASAGDAGTNVTVPDAATCAIRGPYDGGFCDDFELDPDELWIKHTYNDGGAVIARDDAGNGFLLQTFPAHDDAGPGPFLGAEWERSFSDGTFHSATCHFRMRFDAVVANENLCTMGFGFDTDAGPSESSITLVTRNDPTNLFVQGTDGLGGYPLSNLQATPTPGVWTDVTISGAAGGAFTLTISAESIEIASFPGLPNIPSGATLSRLSLAITDSTFPDDGGAAAYDDVRCDLN